MFTQETSFLSISFSHLNPSHFINTKLSGYITSLYQRLSIRLLQTVEEPIRLHRRRRQSEIFQCHIKNGSIDGRVIFQEKGVQ